MPFRADLHSARQTSLTAMLLALATILGYVEVVLIPSLPVPGLKLGIANVVVVVAIATVGPARAAVVSVGRVLLVGLATGMIGGPVMILALSGAIASWAVMALMARQGNTFSVVGWSAAGSCAHAAAQLFAAVAITSSAAPLMLMPIALAMSLITGLIIGFIALLLVSRVPALRPVSAGV